VDVEALESEALSAIAAARSVEELDDARVRFLGRKSPLKLALREVRDRESGMALNAVRERLEAAVDERQRGLERPAADETFDPTLPGAEIPRGTLHPLTQVRRRVEDVFMGMGYEVYDGREVETVWHNFDALNQPEAHPTRDPRDTFYLDEQTLLRTHTSPSQIRRMMETPPPLYMVALGRTYRRDAIDATHTPIFHQVEGLAVDRHITLADLRGTIEQFASAIFGGRRRVRMRTSFFPFTEPSVEFDVTCFICGGAGCATCKHSGWIELLGAGMVHPAVFEAAGLDSERYTGWAFGMGPGRIAMSRYGINDIRLLYDSDIRFLEQFVAC
jgi:phenylalanyl-tRNA synthetase alpha chain